MFNNQNLAWAMPLFLRNKGHKQCIHSNSILYDCIATFFLKKLYICRYYICFNDICTYVLERFEPLIFCLIFQYTDVKVFWLNKIVCTTFNWQSPRVTYTDAPKISKILCDRSQIGFFGSFGKSVFPAFAICKTRFLGSMLRFL
jgi:hypothetical protein